MNGTHEFYAYDYAKTLFPLRTNKLLVEIGASKIKDYISLILNDNDKIHSFLPQQRVYAAKQNWHLRRTYKLDPVAEYFIYDIVYRNRTKFSKITNAHRTSFGYRFSEGQPISPTESYKAFKKAIAKSMREYKHFVCFDIASYFNSIYHHDLYAWFLEKGASDNDVRAFGQYFREIASGRSIDCLPQGLYPTKMIGNDLLNFVNNSFRIKSKQMLRFMDDFYIFDDEENNLLQDFITIQTMLGEKGMSINPKKTSVDQTSHLEVDKKIDAIKKKLLDKRREIINEYDEEYIVDFAEDLDDEELEYIDHILRSESIEEEDAELVLSVMRNHTENVMDRLDYFLNYFPNLSKNIYYFCAHVEDKNELAKIILGHIDSSEVIQEYQLFWIGMILEDHLMKTEYANIIIAKLLEHKSATEITKAKIIEIPDQRYGLQDKRDEIVKTGQSNWLSWAAAAGFIKVPLATRKYKLGYFAKSSPMNHLIFSIICAK